MSEATHRALIRLPYDLRIYALSVFTESEIQLLRKYGTWLEALAESRIAPLSDAQSAFVSVCEGTAPARTEFEKVWHKYQLQRFLERASVGDYFERAAIYGIAAQLGSEVARRWLEAERSHLESEGRMPDTRPALLPLEVPPLRFASDVPVGSGASRTLVAQTEHDWTNCRDDLDGSDWEAILGGPDD
jgi:hypothetical protein